MDPSAPRGDHREYEDMAVAHVLGGLDEPRARLFRAHLLECADCRARVGELRAIAHELAGVERAERRVRATQAVETKPREDEDEPNPLRARRRGRGTLSRVLALGGVTVLVVLLAYALTLRGQVVTLEQALEERLDASAALEHGDPLRVSYAAPGVTATAKVHGNRLVVLADGVEDELMHGLYLVAGTGTAARTLRRESMRPTSGRLFFLVRLQGPEERLIVTRPAADAAVTTDPGGTTILEARLPSRQD